MYGASDGDQVPEGKKETADSSLRLVWRRATGSLVCFHKGISSTNLSSADSASAVWDYSDTVRPREGVEGIGEGRRG